MSKFTNWPEFKGFSWQVLASRWFMIFASLLIMSVNGTSYVFPLYSGAIKTSQGYEQTVVSTLGFYKDLGGNLGVTAGLIYEVLPPWTVISIGSIMNFAAYFVIWEAVVGRIAKPRVWQMCLYMCLATNAASYPNTGALVTAVRNFPESRGGVIGLLKGLIGLSGAVLTQIYHAFYGNDSTSLILLIAWLPAIVPLIFLPAIRIMKVVRRRAKELNVFYNFLSIALGLAAIMMILIIIQNKHVFTRAEYITCAVLVLMFLFLPLAIVIQQEFNLWQSKKQALDNPPPHVSIVAENPPAAVLETQSPKKSKLEPTTCMKDVFDQPDRGEDYTILQAIFSIDMLIILISTTCSVGGELAAINNMGQIANSLGYQNRNIATFISLVSIWNFLGRVLAGFASEIVLTKYRFPRPLILSIMMLLGCIGHVLIACGVHSSLYFSSILIGVCLGAQLPLVSTIISEVYGLKHFSTLYSVGSISSPIGSYIFSVKIAGRLYDKEAREQLQALGLTRQPGKPLMCTGVTCFRKSFLIITAATFFGFLVSILLVLRTRKFYQGDIYKQFREEATAAEAGKTSTKITETEPAKTEPKATLFVANCATNGSCSTSVSPNNRDPEVGLAREGT